MVISRPRKSSLRKIQKKEKKNSEKNGRETNYLINLNFRLTNHVDYQAIILLGTFHQLIRKEKHVRIRPNPVVLFNFGLKSTKDHNRNQNHLVFQCFPAHKSFLKILLPVLIGSCLLSQSFDFVSIGRVFYSK